MAPKIDTEHIIDNISNYTEARVTAMKEFAKKVGTKKAPTAEEDELTKEAKRTADDFKKDSHDATLERLEKEANVLYGFDMEDLDTLLAKVLSLSKEIEKITDFCRLHDISDRYESENLYFYRITYPIVYASSLKVLSMKTITDMQVKAFPSMPKTPSVLSDILGNTWIDHGDSSPDYNPYIQKAMLLQDDVAKPFLKILNEYLSEVLAALKDIECWLSEPERDTQFLNDLFGTDLKVPSAKYDFFMTETFNLMTTTATGNMQVSLSVSDEKEMLRHLVAFAKLNKSSEKDDLTELSDNRNDANSEKGFKKKYENSRATSPLFFFSANQDE